MKRTVFFGAVLFLLVAPFFLPSRIQAACQVGEGKKFTTSGYFTGNKGGTSSFALSQKTKTFTRLAAQCTNPLSTGPYTISCDTDTESFAADSLLSPLCGSSDERGKRNATCYSCGGDIKCDGFDGAAGLSSPFIENRGVCAFDQGNPNSDVWCPAVPPDQKEQDTFTYNGKEYPYHGERIIVCGSNTQACGSADSCTNILYSEEDDQCANPVGVAAGSGGVATPSCDSKGSVNVLDYFTPGCTGANCASEPINGSVFTDTAFYAGGITNSISRSGDTLTQRTNLGGSTPRSIIYKVSGNAIRMVEDHTFEDEATCSDTGNEAYQVIDGGQGIALYNTSMTCGQSVTGTSTNEAYDARTKQKCTNQFTGTGSYESKLVFEGSAMCNGTSVDAVAFQNVSGKGAGEVLVYCKDASGGRGLCAFYSSVDFTKSTNDPKNWSGMDICNGTFSPYPSCKVHGRPQATGVAPVTGTINFGAKCGNNPLSLGCIIERIELAIGTVFPSDNTLGIPDLTRMASNFQYASPFTMPLELLKTETKIRPLTFSATGTVSVAADEGTKCIPENRGVITTRYTGLEKAFQEIIKNASNMIPDGQLKNRFKDLRRDYPDQYLTPKDNRGCPGQTEGIEQRILDQGSSSFHDYIDIPGPLKAVITLANRIPALSALLHGGQSCNPATGECGATSNFTAQVMMHTLCPYCEEMAALMNVSKTGDQKGLARTFLPISARATYKAGLAPDQELAYLGASDLGGNPVMDVPSVAVGGVTEGWQDMKCAVAVHSRQNTELSWGCSDSISPVPNRSQGMRKLQCDDSKPSGLSAPSIGTPPASGPNPITYQIPYKQTGCRLPEGEFQCNVIRKLKQLYPAYWEEGALNIEQYWNTIQAKVAQFANPTFALALWIEETAANGKPNAPGLGCLTAGNGPEAIERQLDCLKGVIDNSGGDFASFMCQWSGEERDKDNHCTSFTRNPSFIHNLRFWYDFLSQQQPASCQITTL